MTRANYRHNHIFNASTSVMELEVELDTFHFYLQDENSLIIVETLNIKV